jgi:hypothetical protein
LTEPRIVKRKFRECGLLDDYALHVDSLRTYACHRTGDTAASVVLLASLARTELTMGIEAPFENGLA